MNLFGNMKPTPATPTPGSNEPPKQYVKPQGAGLKPQANPFGGNSNPSQPKVVQFGQQSKQTQPPQSIEGRSKINDVLSGGSGQKRQHPSQSMFTSKPQQLEINTDKSTLGRQSVPQSSSKSTGVRYKNNYNPLAIYDILNDYYQLCQFPTEVNKDLVVNLSKTMLTLFKQGQNEQKQQYSINKIQFTALNTIPEDYKETIKNFWFEVIKQFIENWHPYCSFEGIIALTQFHLKQNHERYYPSGKYNIQPFLQVMQPNIPKNATLANMNINMGFNLKSAFVQEILQALSQMLCVFINQFCTILAAVPKDLFQVLLNNQIIVQNIFKVIKDIFNVDYAYRCGDQWTKHQIGVYLFNSLIHLHAKNAAIFNKNFVNQFTIFMDRHLSLISPNFSVKVPAELDKTPQSGLARKSIKLLNSLLFKFPYQLQKWQNPIKNTITHIKSANLAPLKWVLQSKKSQPYFSGSRFRQSFDHHEQPSSSINTTAYFPILGTQWLLLLKNMIKNEPTSASPNQYYKNTVFYLMCSVIESDTIGFWMDAQAYQQIHNQIIDIYQDLEKSLPNSIEERVSIGKLCRIMVCACGNMAALDRASDIPKQLIEKLCKDTITLSTSSISIDLNTSKNTNFSSLVLSHFASTIIGSQSLTRDILFGQIFLSQLVHEDIQIQIFNSNEPSMLHKYSYETVQQCVYQLVRRIITENVNTVDFFAELWAKQMAKAQLLQSNTDEQVMIQFLFAITFGQLVKVSEVLASFNPNQSMYKSTNALSPFNFLPQIFKFLNNLLRYDSSTKQLTINLLTHNSIVKNSGLRQLLSKCMNSQQNYIALTQHIQCLYQCGCQGLQWCADVCMNVLAQGMSTYEEIGARCYANVTRIAVAKKCLSHGENQPLAQLNMLKISPVHQFLSSSTIQLRLSDSSMLKIPQLIKYSDYILEFIKWALKIEEDSLHPENFYNSLYVLGKFETLSAALKLLEVLIVTYSRFHDRVHFVQKLRRFLSVCVLNSREIGPLAMGSVNSLSNTPQIYLSNKKVATLPACLAYIIIEPGLLRRPAVKQSQMLRAKQIRSLAINILNLIILNLNNPTLVMLSSASAWQSPYSNVDPLASIDFSVYQQFFTQSSQKAYASPKQKLLAHIGHHLCHSSNEVKTLTPLTWFQTSYMYGQYVDLMLQSTKLFNQQSIKQAIQKRINQQLQNRDKLSTQIRRAFNKVQGDLTSLTGDRISMPSYLIGYLCDRQVAAYSRYILQLCLHIQPPNGGQQHHMSKLLQVVLNKLLVMIVEQPDGYIKNNVVQSISLNIWKSLRILQTKQQHANSLKLFTVTICRCMPFILNYYHLHIKSAEYIKQYLTSFRIILACKQYLTPTLYNAVLSVQKLRQMLVRLMRETAANVQYYTVLMYAVNLYMDCISNNTSTSTSNNSSNGSDLSYKEELYSIYQIVNETINPVINTQESSISNSYKIVQKRELFDLNKDITVVSLILFFKQQIGQQIQNRESSSANLFSLLLSSNPTSSSSLSNNSAELAPSFNLQSLLFNFSGNRLYIPAALQIASNASHYLEFVSVCNYLYRMIAAKDNKYNIGLGIDHDYDLMNQTILVFIQKILDLTVKTDSAWRNLVYMKSWACNLLYIMITNCSKPTLFKISHLLLNKNNLITLMGELLTLYGQVQIKWSYSYTRSIPVSKLGLLQKQLLLSVLKVYAALIARNQDWFKKPTFGNNDSLKKSNFYNLCKMFVNASKILGKSSTSPLVDQFRNTNSYDILSIPSTTVARGQFQQTLQKFAVQSVYGSLQSSAPHSSHIGSPSLPRLSSIQSSKLRILHPDCTSVLDIVHDHFNLLISQKYLMILMGCYAINDLTLDKYQFVDVMAVFQAVSRRLAQISSINASASPGYKAYQMFLREIDKKVWSTTKMSTNLCYLNQIQESPKDQKQLLNNIAELTLNCLLTIKASMEMHQDYKQFYLKADKLFKTARKSEKIYEFDIKDYIEAGGFQGKSQYGASFMVSPSTKRYSGTATKFGF